MATTPESNSRLSSASTIILLVAAAIAAASVGVALWRANGSDSAQASPAAKDWRTVGWAYAEAGDALASASAYRRATEVEPDNAENWSSLGEALQVASTNVVPEAAAAFETALKLDPSDPRARYFLSVQKDLSGDHKAAIEGWVALLRDTPPGAPWQADLQRTISQTAAKHRIDVPAAMLTPVAAPVATAAIPGPTAEQMAAASSIPPSQQDEMVRGMVERLAARLASNPRDADGWIRLMRSRSVLKDPGGAKEALRTALSTFSDDEATQRRLRSAAAQLGIAPGS
jgi:cytochrome c-type biogenesis protein CcmH